MTRLRSVWATLLVGALSASGGPSGSFPGGTIMDFGDHPGWRPQERSVKLANTGDEPFRIVRIQKSCGCITASADTDRLEPGKAATITVVVAADELIGGYRKTVRVLTEPPQQLLLTITGRAAPLVEVLPQRNVNLGNLLVGQSRKQAFAINPVRQGTELGEPVLQGEITGMQRGRRLEVVANPSKAGLFRASITIPVISPKHCSPIRITLFGRAVARPPE